MLGQGKQVLMGCSIPILHVLYLKPPQKSIEHVIYHLYFGRIFCFCHFLGLLYVSIYIYIYKIITLNPIKSSFFLVKSYIHNFYMVFISSSILLIYIYIYCVYIHIYIYQYSIITQIFLPCWAFTPGECGRAAYDVNRVMAKLRSQLEVSGCWLPCRALKQKGATARGWKTTIFNGKIHYEWPFSRRGFRLGVIWLWQILENEDVRRILHHLPSSKRTSGRLKWRLWKSIVFTLDMIIQMLTCSYFYVSLLEGNHM